MIHTLTEIECIRVKGSSRVPKLEKVAVESLITLIVNDEVSAELLYTAGLEKELVYGHLLSSGMIHSLSQIGSFKRKGTKCRIKISDANQREETEEVQLEIGHDKLIEVREALTENQKNHYATRGFHGALLWEIPTDSWFMCEDIGRHNAVDKVIGYGLKEGYSLSHSMILLSGRLVSNIVSKCVNSKIPLIASMTVATDRGIALACEANITIVGSLSEHGFWLYHEGAVKIT
jgi:formate dehydrogenase assembly factor FdhD